MSQKVLSRRGFLNFAAQQTPGIFKNSDISQITGQLTQEVHLGMRARNLRFFVLLHF